MSTATAPTLSPSALATLVSVHGPTPRPSGPLATTATIAWRALVRIRHVPEQLFDVTGFPVIMLLLFTFLFGGAVDGSTAEYLQFLLPGLLVMITAMGSTSTAARFASDVREGLLDRLRTSPIWQPGALTGALLADLARYAIAGIVAIGTGYALGFRAGAGLPGVLLALGLVLLFGWCLSWVFAAVGLVARSPESVGVLGMTVSFPLSFVSNVFVDPATLPGWLRGLVEANPISRLVSASRDLMHANAAGADVAWAVGGSLVTLAIFVPLSMALYRRER